MTDTGTPCPRCTLATEEVINLRTLVRAALERADEPLDEMAGAYAALRAVADILAAADLPD